jgi:hypothetical protein
MSENKLINYVILIVTFCLAIILMSVVGVLLLGLFNDKIDNAEVFKIIEPSFNMIIGSFVGLIGGIQIGKKLT